MSNFTRETDARYPSREDVEQIVDRARQMRSEAIGNAASSMWAGMRHLVTRKDVRRAPRHA